MAEIKPFGEFGVPYSQLLPFHIAMLMPDFVVALALSYQEYGLTHTPQSREEPMLDPESLWRISSNMNVVAVPPPVRQIDRKTITILNARRAGNRGREIEAPTLL